MSRTNNESKPLLIALALVAALALSAGLVRGPTDEQVLAEAVRDLASGDEPGIYIVPDDEDAPPEMRGIGIRIEDDVLVTAGGYEVLSAAVPKQIPDVEALTTA